MRRANAAEGVATSLARAALRGKVVILTYHRVLPPGRLRAGTIDWRMGVSTDAFAAHARWLGRWTSVVDEEGLCRKLAARGSESRGKPSVLITFDDGWRDNLDHALPVLRLHAFPATIYLCTDHVETGEPFWWEVVEAASERLGTRGLAARLAELGLPDAARLDTMEAILARLKTVPGPDLLRLARALRDTGDAERRVLSWREVEAVGSAGDVAFGAHTKTHAILPALTDEQVEAEVGRSCEAVRARPVPQSRFFCFPNGDRDERGVAALRRAGLERGLGLGQRAFRPRDAGSVLPRVNIGMHNAPDAAGLALTLAKAGFRARKEAA